MLLQPKDMERLRGELLKPGTKPSKHLDFHKKSLQLSKSRLSAHEYILSDVVQFSLGTEFNPILEKANLAVLLGFFYTAQEGSSQASEQLKNIDRLFPRLIGVPFTKNNFDIALDLRTQAFIAEFRQRRDDGDFNPTTFVDAFFHEEGGELRSWNGKVGYNKWKINTIPRVSEIRHIMSEDEDNDLDLLAERFPWAGFVREMVEYIRSIYSDPEIKTRVRDALVKAEEFEALSDSESPSVRNSPEPTIPAEEQQEEAEEAPAEDQEEEVEEEEIPPPPSPREKAKMKSKRALREKKDSRRYFFPHNSSTLTNLSAESLRSAARQ